MSKFNSLADFATKRFRLAGKAYLENGDPFFAPIDRLRHEAEARGDYFVSFANYDYLGLSTHPAIKSACADALETTGVGALASRLVGGERAAHHILEQSLADFLRTDAALTLVSGYLTNVTTIAHVMGTRDAIFIDELSHNSIVSGAKSAVAETIIFRHNDLDHLDHLLTEKRGQFRNVMVIAESLYSMDGDIVDLPALVALKRKHNAWLLIDEAHSIGVLGAEGRGICEYSGVDPNEIDLIIGTLSKTLASCGGFIAGKQAVIEWLRYTLPGFVYSVGLSPVISAAAHMALQLVQKETWRLERLRRNAELFVELAHEAGLDTGPAIGRGVIPIMFRDSHETLAASAYLMENGFYVPPIIQIGVPKDQPRLRFFLSASHSEAEIRGVISLLGQNLPAQAPATHPISAAG
ncbi:aminotransferase class I/II-fold pyridoxal phosphate-dependent enzyme [Beijerinckia indica]|uniref:8-amino-7-oxononanoate synthase n=1 Tax=Beijerinckia indica subsp. indica (strain ATCC 9039 / DSM 1715 / NCIMB 8712) TaxID=395963 RepID=B2IBE8_BEII9|nr:aminotransferase class I/II-fold pyridoxal phosphate-dependent enzyme [Beijerinckia indica]ACB96574.1 8-amino-7-oxononanoate synthase [Beijerinckia indica subsp. indica ATCC 9039]